MKKFLFILLTVCALSACEDMHTASVRLPDGFMVKAQVADTPAQQERGLMYVTQLPENKGMLFVFDQEDEQLFWMKNTLIDLDIVFIAADKTVNQVAAQVPHSTVITPDDEVAVAPGYGQYVLELAAGTAAKHGLVPGSKLAF